MKLRIVKIASIVALTMLLNGCALVHHYDEITGKVVELETGKPIEGAAVHASYYTIFYNMIDPTNWYLNSQETLTNANGEFVIPAQLAFTFRPMNLFKDWVPIMIFKPGYGCYGNPGEKSGRDVEGDLEFDKNALVGLPKLSTVKDRIESTSCYPSPAVPDDDYRLLLDLINEENVNLGLLPKKD